jgi:hypothetical protein
MKWIVLTLLVPGVALAVCSKGQSEWRGECVVDLVPLGAPAVKPSDEVPPSDKMPSYQREGIQVVDAPNMATEDERLDREKIEAEKDGKKAAGIH